MNVAARTEGFPDFQFTERIAQGKMKRAERRKEYFPVYFVEPYKGNEMALGFDLASNPDTAGDFGSRPKDGRDTCDCKNNPCTGGDQE